MSSFDFTALIVFLQSLFDALAKLAAKLGFSIGGDTEETDETEEAPATEE